jgi:hypothetical protein
MKVLFSLLLLCATFTWALGQDVPASDIYLFDFEQKADKQFSLANPRLLTYDNRGGYNNQPQFIGDKLYIASRTQADPSQTDIYALDLKNWVKTQVTSTKQSEYSPQPMPDGVHFSVVRVESDGAQYLWKYPLDQSDEGEAIFPKIKNVGYYCWLNELSVALYLVGTPSMMHVANVNSGDSRFVVSNIGRGMQKLPNNELAFVYKRTETKNSVREMSRQTFRTRDLSFLPGNSEDFVCLPDGTLIVGNGSRLYKYNLNSDTYWMEIADLKKFGIENISRLAVAKGKIAIVNTPK